MADCVAGPSLTLPSLQFPGSGLFAQVQNGKQNPMHIVLHNGASSDITLVGASASFHDPLHSWKTLRNVRALLLARPTCKPSLTPLTIDCDLAGFGDQVRCVRSR